MPPIVTCYESGPHFTRTPLSAFEPLLVSKLKYLAPITSGDYSSSDIFGDCPGIEITE